MIYTARMAHATRCEIEFRRTWGWIPKSKGPPRAGVSQCGCERRTEVMEHVYSDKVEVDDDVLYDDCAPVEQPAPAPETVTSAPQAEQTPAVPVVVKPWRQDTDNEVETQTSIVEMSLLRDLRHRLDKRTLSAEQLAELAPEMADAEDGEGCRPQCMVCLEELETGQAVSRQACGHTFHHECMANWLVSQLQNKQVGGCPHCKHTIVVPIIQRVETPVELPAHRARPASRWDFAALGGNFCTFNFCCARSIASVS